MSKKFLAGLALLPVFFLPLTALADLGPNLIKNPTFASNTTGWTAQPASGNSTSFTYPVAGQDGNAAGIKVTKYKSGDVFWQPTNAPVTAGKQYQFSAYSLNSVPVVVIAAYLNSKGTATSFATLGTVPAGTSWQDFTATITIPTGVTQVRIQHVIRAVGSLAVDNYSLQLVNGTSTPPPPPPPPPAPPVITSFTATPSQITAGQSSTLAWATTGATALSINQGVGVVTGTSKPVSPTATTTYTLTAGNGTATTTASVTVNVSAVLAPPPPPAQKPTITSFTANPVSVFVGSSTVLLWVVTGASTTAIDQGVGAVTGTSKTVFLNATTTYTLSAANPAGTTTAQVTVNVKSAPVQPPPPPPGPNLIPNGNLEAGTTNPTGWTHDFWGTLTAKFTYPVAGNPPAGGASKAAQIQITKFTTGAANWIFNHVTDSPHTQYQFNEDYMATVPTELDVEFLMSDGTFQYTWLQTVPASATWQTLSAQVTPPPGAVSFTVLHILAQVGTLTIDNASLNALTDPFAQGMVTFAFDDGLLSQFQNALPIMNAAGFKGTYYIITTEPTSGDDDQMTWAQIKSLATQGQEIGGHTRTHPFLTQLTAAQVTSEVTGSFQDLVAQGFAPTTFAYPYGDESPAIEAAVKAAGYAVARGSYEGLNGPVTNHYDLYDIRIDTTSTLATIEAEVDQAKADKRWMIFEIHDVLASGGDVYSITPAFFQSLVTYIKNSGIQVVTTQQGAAQLNP